MQKLLARQTKDWNRSRKTIRSKETKIAKLVTKRDRKPEGSAAYENLQKQIDFLNKEVAAYQRIATALRNKIRLLTGEIARIEQKLRRDREKRDGFNAFKRQNSGECR